MAHVGGCWHIFAVVDWAVVIFVVDEGLLEWWCGDCGLTFDVLYFGSFSFVIPLLLVCLTFHAGFWLVDVF